MPIRHTCSVAASYPRDTARAAEQYAAAMGSPQGWEYILARLGCMGPGDIASHGRAAEGRVGSGPVSVPILRERPKTGDLMPIPFAE